MNVLASCYLLKYLEYPIAVATKRLLITVYIAQKGVFDLSNTGLSIEMITKEEMCNTHSMIMLDEHETGFVVSAMDVNAYKERKDTDIMRFDDLIEDLKNVLEELKKDKDKKKIEKAIEVLEDNADKLKGKSHWITIMEDIVSIGFSTIVEESEMMGLYRRNKERDTFEAVDWKGVLLSL